MFFLFVFLSMIFYKKRARNLCNGARSKSFWNQTALNHSPQKTRIKAPVQLIRVECDRKIASPQKHTQEPRINNDIFIKKMSLKH